MLPDDVLLALEAQIRLVPQRRRLQRVVAALSAQMHRGASSELLVDDRYHAIGRSRFASRPRAQQRRDFHALGHVQTHRMPEWRWFPRFLAS
jgi:hypothetical protein